MLNLLLALSRRRPATKTRLPSCEIFATFCEAQDFKHCTDSFPCILLYLFFSSFVFTVSLFCILDPHTPSPSLCTDLFSPVFSTSTSPLPFLPLLPTSNALLSLLTQQRTRSKKSFHFMYLLFQRSVWELSCLESTMQRVYLCIHSLKDFKITLIRLSSTNKKICCSWS